MNDISHQCDQILAYHKNLGRTQISALLNAGISAAKIAQQTADLPFVLPKSMTEMYGWRNGTREGEAVFDDMWLFPGYYFLLLDEGVASYWSLIEHVPKLWGKRWFPFMCSGAGDFFAIQCAGKSVGDGEVIKYLRGEPETFKVFSGLHVMLQTLIACFHKGVFFVTDDGDFDMDDVAFRAQAEACEGGSEP